MSIFKAISNLFSSKSKAATPEKPMNELELGNDLAKRELEAAQAALKAKRLALEEYNKQVLKNVEGENEAKDLARKLTTTFGQLKDMDKARRNVEKRLRDSEKAWALQVESNYNLIASLRNDYQNSLLELDEEEEEETPPSTSRWANAPVSSAPAPVSVVDPDALEEQRPITNKHILERGKNPNVPQR